MDILNKPKEYENRIKLETEIMEKVSK